MWVQPSVDNKSLLYTKQMLTVESLQGICSVQLCFLCQILLMCVWSLSKHLRLLAAIIHCTYFSKKNILQRLFSDIHWPDIRWYKCNGHSFSPPHHFSLCQLSSCELLISVFGDICVPWCLLSNTGLCCWPCRSARKSRSLCTVW